MEQDGGRSGVNWGEDSNEVKLECEICLVGHLRFGSFVWREMGRLWRVLSTKNIRTESFNTTLTSMLRIDCRGTGV